MPATFAERLSSFLPAPCVQQNVMLRAYTTLRVGGPADYFVEPETEEQALKALLLARECGVPVLLLGNGSNLLVADGGFRGMALYFGARFARVEALDGRIHAQAGALLAAAARAAEENALEGLAFAAGIPGSVGGGAAMNAGAYGGEMKDVIDSVRGIADGKIITLSNQEARFHYRGSAISENGWAVVSVEFALKPGDRAAIHAQTSDLNARRREKQPLQYPSAGSFFKRPEGHFAGALIQQANLKGFSIGGAQVSEKHAGFLINTGDASAADFYALMRHVQNAVYETSGVKLCPEVRLIGDFEAEK